MQQRQIGSTALTVSTVGLGCNNFGLRIDAEASRTVIHKALDLGITFFDTSVPLHNYLILNNFI